MALPTMVRRYLKRFTSKKVTRLSSEEIWQRVVHDMDIDDLLTFTEGHDEYECDCFLCYELWDRDE